MKKIIIFILLVLQSGWANSEIVVSEIMNNKTGQTEQEEIKIENLYGLVKIACTVFVSSINNVVEISCEIPVGKKKPKASKSSNFEIHIYFSNSIYRENVKYSKKSEIFSTGLLVVSLSRENGDVIEVLMYKLRWLWYIFSLFCLYKFFYLRPRGCVSKREILLLLGLVKIPNCSSTVRDFLFYEPSLIKTKERGKVL